MAVVYNHGGMEWCNGIVEWVVQDGMCSTGAPGLAIRLQD